MRKSVFILFIFLTINRFAFAQTFTDSNLPIVIINTDGAAPILDDPRVLASFRIIWRGEGQRNYLADQDTEAYLNYNGRIDIEVRGSSSQALPKTQYGFTTLMADNISNNNVSLLGMPAENDWILNALAFDPALIRNYLCYNLSRQIGQYASRTAWCEVIINGTYKGLYVLQEKVKQGDDRVDVKKISSSDVVFPDVTGGYITKADKTNGDPVAFRMSSYSGTNDINFIHEMPKPENVKPAQNSYIGGEFMKLANAALLQNNSFLDGVPSIIDIPSFIDFILLNEFASNSDAYEYSTYFHKDRNGKLRAGPVWDMDLTFGNDLFHWGYDRSKTNIWQFSNGDNDGARFWRDLNSNPEFKCLLSKRWNELISPGNPFHKSEIEGFIDETTEKIREAAVRENALWGTVGDLNMQIQKIKSFIEIRKQWMNSQIGSIAGCPVYHLPTLVINRIMFNPPEGDPEFIEITNTGNKPADLTGVYFSNTGMVYQFAPYSILLPGDSKILTDDKDVFLIKYGFFPSGEYNRKLSDTGMEVILADGFGNTIDRVSYSAALPWPDANGNGSYLSLTDPLSDNNDPVNWIAINNTLVSVHPPEQGNVITVYPNPVDGITHIVSSLPMNSIQLTDLHGNIIQLVQPGATEYDLDMTACHPGFFILRIYTQEGFEVKKIVRR